MAARKPPKRSATWKSSRDRSIEYRGTILNEMDLDAIIARKPDLAIVDELAHTNAPGSKHEKRYQDIAELLATVFWNYCTNSAIENECLQPYRA